MNHGLTSTHARRALVALGIGVGAALLAWWSVTQRGAVSDFGQVWFAAREILAGRDPYPLIGPGRAFDWPFPLLYPLPAALAVTPLAPLPVAIAGAAFSGISAALLAFALTRDDYARLPVFLSFAFFYAAALAQWSPLLTAAAILPGLGVLFVAKPTLGAVLWCYRPSWRSLAAGVGLIGAGVALQPTWPREWLATLGAFSHATAPITCQGGPLIALALLRWRRPEARLLLALACVPHTALLYETVPLFLVPASWREALALAALTWVAQLVTSAHGPYRDLAVRVHVAATVSVVLLYLPCLALVLSRRNEGDTPAWLTRWLNARKQPPSDGDAHVDENGIGRLP